MRQLCMAGSHYRVHRSQDERNVYKGIRNQAEKHNSKSRESKLEINGCIAGKYGTTADYNPKHCTAPTNPMAEGSKVVSTEQTVPCFPAIGS